MPSTTFRISDIGEIQGSFFIPSHTLPFLIISGDRQKFFMFGTQKSRTDFNVIHEENDVIEMGKLARLKSQLKQGEHTFLIMRMEHPRAYMIR